MTIQWCGEVWWSNMLRLRSLQFQDSLCLIWSSVLRWTSIIDLLNHLTCYRWPSSIENQAKRLILTTTPLLKISRLGHGGRLVRGPHHSYNRFQFTPEQVKLLTRLPLCFSDTAFKQQRLKAWQPILTPKTVLPIFFLIGIIFAPIGGILLWGSNKVYNRLFEPWRSSLSHKCCCSSPSFRSPNSPLTTPTVIPPLLKFLPVEIPTLAFNRSLLTSSPIMSVLPTVPPPLLRLGCLSTTCEWLGIFL